MDEAAIKFQMKEVIAYFFTPCADADFYMCNNPQCKSIQKQKKSTGYTNLKNHLRSCIGDNFLGIYDNLVKSSKDKGRLDSYGFINNREKEVYNIINWIVDRNQPISEVDNAVTRNMFKTKPICSKTLRKYILALTPYVEKAIDEDLPDKFGLIFDGWTSATMHYVAIFASYTKDGMHKESLLAVAPLVNEEQLGAEQHIEFMHATLLLYRKTLDNVVVLIGDNCSTNKKIADDTAIPLIGCASHRFNLAVNSWLEERPEYEQVLDAIHKLMVQLRQLKNAARLRALTDLCAIKHSVTRWSSKYDMAQRYIKIEAAAKGIPQVEDLILTPRQRRTLDELNKHLSNFQSVTKSLQLKDMSTLQVREVFDGMLEQDQYPEMKNYLSARADIVNNPDFESGLNKILGNAHFSMTPSERDATSLLLNNRISGWGNAHDESKSESENISYFEKIRKRKRCRLSDEQVRYIDCSFCVATSNTVERLFSACKHILTDQRKHMSPIMFEALIFLKVNQKFWDVSMVAMAMKKNQPRGVERDLDMFYEQ